MQMLYIVLYNKVKQKNCSIYFVFRLVLRVYKRSHFRIHFKDICGCVEIKIQLHISSCNMIVLKDYLLQCYYCSGCKTNH